MIFEDPSQRRRKKIVYISVGLLIIGGLIIVVIFLMSLIKSNQTLKLLNLESSELFYLYKEKSTKALIFQDDSKDKIIFDDEEEKKIKKSLKKLKTLPVLLQKPFIYSAFVKQDEIENTQILEDRLKKIDLIFPDWYTLNDSNKLNENINWEIFEYLKKNNVTVIPTFSVSGADMKKVFPEILKNDHKANQLIKDLKFSVKNRSLKGINIDIENSDTEINDPNLYYAYTNWFIDLIKSFHDENLYVVTSVGVDNKMIDYKNIGLLADMFVVKIFNEHYLAGDPGPIASEPWFKTNTIKLLEVIPPKKIIIAISSFGYDWNLDKKILPAINSFDKTLYLAQNKNVSIKFDKKSKNSNFYYVASDGSHVTWFLDAATAWNEYMFIKKKNLYGVSLGGISKLDEDIWKFFPETQNNSARLTFNNTNCYVINLSFPFITPAKSIKEYLQNNKPFGPLNISKIQNQKNITKGDPKIFKILSLKSDGERKFTLSGEIITSTKYSILPKKLIISGLEKSKPKTVALIFDNISNIESDKILDLLKKYKVPATFFPTISQMKNNQDLINKELKNGHLIGINPTFYNNWNDLKISINNSQNIFGYISGYKSFLIKSPSDINSNLTNLYNINNLGYLLVSSQIDEKYSKNELQTVKNIISEMKTNDSNIINLHSYKTLRILIPALKSRGFSFVNLYDLVGVSKNVLIPKISFIERITTIKNYIILWFKDHAFQFIAVIFLLSTGVSIFRIIFLGLYVLRGLRISKKYYSNRFLWNLPKKFFSKKFLKLPKITVLVPAYNEEKVIERTILGLLKSDYPEFEILVINDGSTDKTANEVKKLMKKYENVRLISKKNEGKSLALNVGFKEAKTDFIVTIDADTIIFPYTIKHLIEPFADDRVDSVCGNIGVGNVKNILTAFQEVEYVTGQNFDRRAFDALNCISVVPGATGSWRKQKVIDIGGYSDDTLVEDADLTLTLLENNGHIVYSPMAKSVTEAPETVRALFKQRFRWGYGTFQCFWKHRKTFGKGGLGTVALPNMIVSHLFQNIFSPIGDIVFFISLFIGNFGGIMIAYWVFFLMDVLVSGFAYLLDKKSLKNIWVILIQRFFYRQFMYFVTFSSIVAAFLGTRHGWNKLERKGTVKVTEK